MSRTAIIWARAQKTGSPVVKAVLMAVAVYADDQGSAWPSQARLAEDTELSERAVRGALSELASSGLLARESRHRSDGSRSTDMITLNLSHEGNRQDVPGGGNMVPGVRQDVPGGGAPRARHELSLNYQPNGSLSSGADERVASGSGWPTDFRELFWSAFPNKVGKSSAIAKLEAIRKRGDVPWQRLMGGLRSYTAKTDDRPWCNPLTWLNQGRWDDQPAAAPDRQPRAPPSAQISQASLWKARRTRSESQADEPSDVVPVQFSPGSERGHGPARGTLLEQDRGGTVRQIDDFGARRAFGR